MLEKQAEESVFTGGSSSAQLRLQQDPEPLLLLHQQIPLSITEWSSDEEPIQK